MYCLEIIDLGSSGLLPDLLVVVVVTGTDMIEYEVSISDCRGRSLRRWGMAVTGGRWQWFALLL